MRKCTHVNIYYDQEINKIRVESTTTGLDWTYRQCFLCGMIAPHEAFEYMIHRTGARVANDLGWDWEPM